MILPLLGLAIPLFKLVPPAYQWRVRRRLLRLYSELERIDPRVNPISSKEDAAERTHRIERLDQEAVTASVPRDYKDNIYKLRRDIDLVRRRLSIAAASKD